MRRKDLLGTEGTLDRHVNALYSCIRLILALINNHYLADHLFDCIKVPRSHWSGSAV